MDRDGIIIARAEINETLKYCNFFTRILGFSFIDPPQIAFWRKMKMIYFYFSASLLSLLVAGEMAYVILELISTSSIVAAVATLHLTSYGAMSIGKLLTIWYKKDEFRKLLYDLTDLWPKTTNDPCANQTKSNWISRLRVVQICYAIANTAALLLYVLKPIMLYVYHKLRGQGALLGYIWYIEYPFDKTKPFYHELAFSLEVFTGTTSVMAMIASDLCFMSMSSNISMLLRLLQLRIRRLAAEEPRQTHNSFDLYEDIVSVIKTHQKLISYGNDLENAFALVNLINVFLSSIEICCVAFDILLDPWMEMSNKVYLVATLAQVGIICWYAHEITINSTGIAEAAYECGWYNCNTRSRRALLILIKRSQRPLYFTAYKFRPITMSTYSSILTNSYSYFALLYTMYRSDSNSDTRNN